MGGIIYFDLDSNFEFTNNLPKIYSLKTQPMVLVDTNWTCQTSYVKYEKKIQKSEMNINSLWWKECNPNPYGKTNKCHNTKTWNHLEYNMDGNPEINRYIEYYLEKPTKIIHIRNSGKNSEPNYRYYDFQYNSNYKYKIHKKQCLAKLNFRNVLTGEYFIETTYNPSIYNKLKYMSNKLWNVTYFDKCHFSIYVDLPKINHQIHCIQTIEKLEFSSFDIVNKYKP